MGQNGYRNVSGRAALVISVLALVVAMAGGAYALTLGRGSVKTKNLKNGAVSTKKLKNGAVTEAKIASGAVPKGFINIGPGGVVQASQNVNGITRVGGGQIYCLDAKITVKTIVGQRTFDSGGGVSTEVGLSSGATTLGCPAPFQDAVWQNVGSVGPGNNDGYMIWFG